MSKIYVFRHTQTPDNEGHIFSGRRDVELTELGIEQAKTLAETLKDSEIGIAFCSPMKRTMQTIEYALEFHKKVKICIDDRIIERSYGLLQGRNKDDFARVSLPLFKFFHRSYYASPPGGESMHSVDMRVKPFIEDLIKAVRQTGKNAVVCAHGNSIRPLRIYFEKLPQSQFTKIETMVGEMFVYEVN